MGRAIHPSEPRGYFGVVLWRPKYPGNGGAILRSAVNFGAAFVVIVGGRYKRSAADTLAAENKVPIFDAEENTWKQFLPEECALVSLELSETAKSLVTFDHPIRAAYIFGPEDGSVPNEVLEQSYCAQIPGVECLNVAAAASILMYDRIAKRARFYRRERIVA